MRKNILSALAGIFLLLALCVVVIAGDHGAGNKPPKSVQPKSYANPKNTSQCLVCHGQLDYLRSVCSDGKDGYGHDIAAETVAQGLYVDAAFVNDRIHGKASCGFCHAGDPDAADPEKAHAGLIKDPTADGGEKMCAGCHGEIVDNFKTSVHFNLTGIESKLCSRLGTTPNKDQMVDTIMRQDCMTCHATCGSCHVGTAPVANAGLQANHQFNREPDNLQVCIPCHHLAGAGFFTEEKNLHTAVGMDCNSCHNSDQEFHGRGQVEEQGMMTPGLIKANCDNCHEDVPDSNEAHRIHDDFISCQACHGMEYESCNACHNRQPDMEHIFKLGQFNGKVYPMIHSTGDTSADAFAHFGVELDQKHLESKATWNPYPTHFLQLCPNHKEGGTVMCENCHGNDAIFLQEKDLTFPELEKQLLMETPRALTKQELKDVLK